MLYFLKNFIYSKTLSKNNRKIIHCRNGTNHDISKQKYLTKKKRNAVVEAAYNTYLQLLSETLTDQGKGRRKAIDWDKIRDSSINFVNKNEPDLYEIDFSITLKSLKASVDYKRRSEKKNTVDTVILKVDTDEKNSATTNIIRSPSTDPELKIKKYFCHEWRNFVVEDKVDIYLDLDDTLNAIMAILPEKYRGKGSKYKDILYWPDSENDPLCFLWGVYQESYRHVKNVRSSSLELKKKAQRNFFSLMTTTQFNFKEKNESSSTLFINNAFNKIVPNWMLKISIDVDEQILNGDKLIPEDTRVDIYFSKLGKVSARFKVFPVYFNYSVTKAIKKSSILSTRKILSLTEATRLLLTEIKSGSFDFAYNFNYEALILDCEEFCKLTGYKNECKKSSFKIIGIIINQLNIIFSYFKYGLILRPEKLTAKCKIFIPIDLKNIELNNFIDIPQEWSGPPSRIILIKKKFNVDDNYIYQKLLEASKEENINERNIITKIFPEFHKSESEQEKEFANTIINKKNLEFDRTTVYNCFTEVLPDNENSLSYDSIADIAKIVSKLRSKLSLIQSKFNDLPDLQGIFDQKENKALSTLYKVSLQGYYKDSLNIYFQSINNVIDNDPKAKKFSCSYFDRKVELELNYLNNKNIKDPETLDTLSFLKKKPFFIGLFPRSYYFPNIKVTRDGKKIEIPDPNISRIEESRKHERTTKRSRTGSIISMEKIFRKSFQANLAAILSFDKNKFYALDIDIKGMHANVVLCFLESGLKINWDEEFTKLKNYIYENDKSKRYTQDELKKIGITRDSLKKHYLAILNGRKANGDYEYSFPEAFKKEDLRKKKRKDTNEEVETSKHNYLVNTIIKNFVLSNDFVSHVLEFREIIDNYTYFWGEEFHRDYNIKEKVSFVLQSMESIATMAIVTDVINSNMILHSVERDGIVCFGTSDQILRLSFKNFDKVNQKIFSGGLELTLKYLTKLGEKPPFSNIIDDTQLLDSESNGKESFQIVTTKYQDEDESANQTSYKNEIYNEPVAKPNLKYGWSLHDPTIPIGELVIKLPYQYPVPNPDPRYEWSEYPPMSEDFLCELPNPYCNMVWYHDQPPIKSGDYFLHDTIPKYIYNRGYWEIRLPNVSLALGNEQKYLVYNQYPFQIEKPQVWFYFEKSRVVNNQIFE